MRHGSPRHGPTRLAVLALLLASLGAAAATGARAEAEDVELGVLNEDLRAATARLEYTLEKLQRLGYPMGGDDRRVSRDLLARGKFAMKNAAIVPSTDVEGIREVTQVLTDLKDETNAFLARVAPVWQQPGRQDHAGKYRSPYQEVLKFHDVLEDIHGVRGRLRPEENERVSEIAREGEDVIAGIKATREADHAGRDVLVRHLMGLRKELMGLHALADTDRTKGYSFVALRRAAGPWTECGHVENGLEALRSRFVEPQSAWLTLRNPGEDWRPVFVELQFHDESGAPTGSGTFETAPLEELRAGEVREVLVPIHPTHPQFWEATRSYTVSLN